MEHCSALNYYLPPQPYPKRILFLWVVDQRLMPVQSAPHTLQYARVRVKIEVDMSGHLGGCLNSTIESAPKT